MGKYASWSEFEANAPKNYEEGATPDAYLKGLNGIAPTGAKAKPERGEHYGTGVDGKGPVMVRRFRQAMFTP